MKKPLHHFLLVTALLLFGVSSAIAQSVVTGKIVDENNAPLIGATVVVPGTSQGASTDANGNFTLKLTKPTEFVEATFIGYTSQRLPVQGARTALGVIQLKPDAVTMQDVVITSSIAVARKTPVAVSSITAADIDYKLGSQRSEERRVGKECGS